MNDTQLGRLTIRWPSIRACFLGVMSTLIATGLPAADPLHPAGLVRSPALDVGVHDFRTPTPLAPDRARFAAQAPMTLRGHLVQRLDGQFADFSGLGNRSAPGAASLDPARHRMLVENAGDRLRRGTRQALEDYLRAATPLGRWIDRVERFNPLEDLGRRTGLDRIGRSRGHDEAPPSGQAVGKRRGRAFEFDLGMDGWTPCVEMRRQIGAGLFSATVGVTGRVDVEYQGGRRMRTSLLAGFDALEGRVNMGCTFSF